MTAKIGSDYVRDDGAGWHKRPRARSSGSGPSLERDKMRGLVRQSSPPPKGQGCCSRWVTWI